MNAKKIELKEPKFTACLWAVECLPGVITCDICGASKTKDLTLDEAIEWWENRIKELKKEGESKNNEKMS